MPQERTSKTLSERIDVGFHRRANRFRRWRFHLSLWATVLCAALVVLVETGGSRTIYQAGQLSTAHQMLANDCNRCHTDQWQPLERLISLNDRVVSTPDPACKQCHAGPVHHEDQLPGLTQCADCHREHRGKQVLSRVTDGYCKQCHDDLKTKTGPSKDFAQHVPTFAAHPEFAALRKPDKDARSLPRQQPDPARQIAAVIDGRWQDTAKIRLNHKLHMDQHGILIKPGSTALKVLECKNCHEPDATGRYMAPINFDKHCGECHASQLRFETGDFNGDVGALPHREPEIIRGVLRDRLTKFIIEKVHDDPKFLEGPDDASPDATSSDDALPPFFPTQRPAEKLSKAEWDWVAGRLFEAEGKLFAPSDNSIDYEKQKKSQGCAYCHQITSDAGVVKVTPPRIPNRWLTQSRFQHDRHRMLSCAECHAGGLTGTQTTDIMLPSVESCRQCHGAQSKMTGSARSDCVECHAYHNHREAESFNGPLSIEKLRERQPLAPLPASAGLQE